MVVGQRLPCLTVTLPHPPTQHSGPELHKLCQRPNLSPNAHVKETNREFAPHDSPRRHRYRPSLGAGCRTALRRCLHRQDPRIHHRTVLSDTLRRPSSGIGNGPDPPRCAGSHRGRTRYPQLPRGSVPIHAGRGRRVTQSQGLLHGRDRRGAGDDPRRDLERGHDRKAGRIQGDPRPAGRSAYHARGRSRWPHSHREAHLLGHRGDPLARDRLARDAHGACLPTGGE